VSVLVNQFTSCSIQLIGHTSTILDTNTEAFLEGCDGKVFVGFSEQGVVTHVVLGAVASGVSYNWARVLVSSHDCNDEKKYHGACPK